MGVTYKLNPEIINYILEEKKDNPVLSCRGLVYLVESKYLVKISKSSINALFKNAGLSMPVGRRLKKRRSKIHGLLEMSIQPEIRKEDEAVTELPMILPLAETKEIETVPKPEPTAPIIADIEEIKAAEPSLEPVVEVPVVGESEPKQPIDQIPQEPHPEAGIPEPVAESPIAQEPILPAPQVSVPRSKAELPIADQEPSEPAPPVEVTPSEPYEVEPEPETAAEPKPPVLGIPYTPLKEVPVVTVFAAPLEDLATEAPGLGAILLKAADYLVGGTYSIVQAIENRLRSSTPDMLAKTEALLYRSLFASTSEGNLPRDSGLWPLINYRFTNEELSSYLVQLQQVSALPSDIIRVISSLFQEVRGIRVQYSDGSVFYIDGHFHTLWSAPQLPYDFSATIYNIKGYINKYFQESAPIILFTAPGFDTPTKELFDLMLSMEIGEKKIARFVLYGNKFEDLETVRLEIMRKKGFIVGLWPWQFGQFRKVKTIGEFNSFYLKGANKEFYLADGQFELSQPHMNQKIILRGGFIKTSLEGQIRIIVATNLKPEQLNLQELAESYLSHWPNLEESFGDFSRKIELFTYTVSSQRFFSLDSLPNWMREASGNIIAGFSQYLMALDLYVRWHFLPAEYENKDLAYLKENFYSLKAALNKNSDYLQVKFQPPPGFALIKDLEYICRRLNEKEIILFDNRRVWFSV